MAGGKAPPPFRYRQLGNLAIIGRRFRSDPARGTSCLAALAPGPHFIPDRLSQPPGGLAQRALGNERGARLSLALTPRLCASRHRPPISALTDGSYRHEPVWYRNFQYDAKRERGLDFIEDLASPAVFTWTLNGAWRHPRCEAGSGRALRPLGALAHRRFRQPGRRHRLDGDVPLEPDAHRIRARPAQPRLRGHRARRSAPTFSSRGRISPHHQAFSRGCDGPPAG